MCSASGAGRPITRQIGWALRRYTLHITDGSANPAPMAALAAQVAAREHLGALGDATVAAAEVYWLARLGN